MMMKQIIMNNLNGMRIDFETGGAEPILSLRENGDIYVKGKLIENDKELVDAFRKWLDMLK